jgi:nitroreductase family protein
MTDAILHRKSHRIFTPAPLSEEEMEAIQNKISAINLETGLTIEFEEDGSRAFQDFRKSYGLFKNVRSLILLKGNAGLAHFREKIGFYGEELVLFVEELGIGSCWVGGTFDRESFCYPEDEHIQAVIALGHSGEEGIGRKLIGSLFPMKKKPWHERISGQDFYPHWIQEGMEAVALAPSALNKQKPKFFYEHGELRASVPDNYDMDMVDLGIAKYHFLKGVGEGTFPFGNGAKYQKEENS